MEFQQTENSPEQDLPEVGEETALGDDVLRREVEKWQARVPKLAAALRQRSEELDELRQELRMLRNGGDVDARMQVRDDLIEDLQQKLKFAKTQQRQVAVELHGSQLELASAAQEVADWKSKWHSITDSLDDVAANHDSVQLVLDTERQQWSDEQTQLQHSANDKAAQHDRQVQELRGDLEQLTSRNKARGFEIESLSQDVQQLQQGNESLTTRNQRLQQTTDIANNQMATMSQEIKQMLDSNLQQHSQTEAIQTQHQDELLASSNVIQRLTTDTQLLLENGEKALTDAHHGHQQEVQALQTQLHDLHESLEQAEAQIPADGLQAKPVQADEAKLRQQLEDRADLVRGLEDEAKDCRQQLRACESELAVTAEALDESSHKLGESETRMGTFRDHAQTLEEKLSNQQELLSQLETELSEGQQALQRQRGESDEKLRVAQLVELESANKREEMHYMLNELEEQNKELQTDLDSRCQPEEAEEVDEKVAVDTDAELHQLHKVVQEQSEELQQLRWQCELSGSLAEEKLTLVLKQQLEDAREENQCLQTKLAAQTSAVRDDLTALKGIGPKLAKQLIDLGVSDYAQIAQLSEADLEFQEHLLYPYRGRIIRDGWVEQAKALVTQ